MEMWFFAVILKALENAGVSPVGLVFAVTILVLLFRSWKKEDALSARQDAFFDQQQHFYAGVTEELGRLQKEITDCEQERAKMALATLFLVRWKARCEDVCPSSEEVHRPRAWKPDGGLQ